MSENTSLDIDTESRNRIISEINKNFFVEAGAGSGKTTMLVNRMVAMIEAGVDISKICAITFTKAAAGEFYDRFQKLLIERSNPGYVWEDKGYAGQLGRPTDTSRERCSMALKNIDLCFMGTIDAFCGMVLAEHPSEAGISSEAGVVTDIEAVDFYKQQYVKICAGEYGDEITKLSKTFRKLYKRDEEVFVKGISLLMDNRNVHFNYNSVDDIDIDRDFANDREQIIRALEILVNHPEYKYGGEKNSIAAWEKLNQSYYSISKQWSINISEVIKALNAISKIRIMPQAMDEYADEFKGLFVPGGSKGAWLETTFNKGGLLEKLGNYNYDVTMSLIGKSVPYIEKAMIESSKLTFFDALYYLRNMLKKDAMKDGKLINYIYDHHSYYLIDEFQDTNPLQAEIFFYLASEKPVSLWKDCMPRQGSLFIVGDPKQSIYRFRGADVASFLEVKKIFEEKGGEILKLTRNFRSTRMLCDYYNQVFTNLLPEENDNQSKFDKIPLKEPVENEFEGIYKYKAYTGKAAFNNPEMSDAYKIKEIIERLVGNDDYLIKGKEDAAPGKIKYSDIMVITSSKEKLTPIIAKLTGSGIPCRAEGKVLFGDNKALCEVYKIYLAVSDTDDSSALYGALTGNIIGFTKEEIVIYRKEEGRLSLKASINDEDFADKAAKDIAKSIQLLKNLSVKAKSLSPAALFSEIVDKYCIYNSVAAEDLEVVYYTLELIRNAEKDGEIVSVKDAALLIKKLIGGTSKEERCLSLDESRDSVFLANLHKVKGLEKPIVILSSASKKTFSAQKRIQHLGEYPEGYVFSMDSERNSKGSSYTFFSTNAYDDEKDKENEALDCERKRLTYVAATRAGNALIICDNYYIVGSGKEVNDSKWRGDQIIDNETPEFFTSIKGPLNEEKKTSVQSDSSVIYEEADRTCVLNDRSGEEPNYIMKNPSRLKLVSKITDNDDNYTAEEDVDFIKKHENDTKAAIPALIGTMTHKLMEILVSSKNKVNVNEAVCEIINEYRTPKSETYEKEIKEMLFQVADVIRSGGYPQNNGLPQDILSTLIGADEVYCELPFTYTDDSSEEKTLWNGIMDVVFCIEGKWHIVDYKTNADGKDLDTKYQEQLSAYIKAFHAATGNVAEARTYHIDI